MKLEFLPPPVFVVPLDELARLALSSRLRLAAGLIDDAERGAVTERQARIDAAQQIVADVERHLRGKP